MKRFFKCFFKEEKSITTANPILTAYISPDPLKLLPETLSELIYLETVVYMNLNTFNKEANILSDKAQTCIAMGDMYKGMFFLRQRRYVIEESSKLLQVLDDIKTKKKYLQDFPAEFRAAKKIKL